MKIWAKRIAAVMMLCMSALFAFDHNDSLGSGWSIKRGLICVSFAGMAVLLVKDDQ